jgi:hypothetical protein
MNEGNSYSLALEIIQKEERSEERKAKLQEEILKMLKDLPLQVDSKGREVFN